MSLTRYDPCDELLPLAPVIGKPAHCIEGMAGNLLQTITPSKLWSYSFEFLEMFLELFFSRLSPDRLLTKVLQFVFVNPRCKRGLISNYWSYIFIGDYDLSMWSPVTSASNFRQHHISKDKIIFLSAFPTARVSQPYRATGNTNAFIIFPDSWQRRSRSFSHSKSPSYSSRASTFFDNIIDPRKLKLSKWSTFSPSTTMLCLGTSLHIMILVFFTFI